jgi:hypothetical protein
VPALANQLRRLIGALHRLFSGRGNSHASATAPGGRFVAGGGL